MSDLLNRHIYTLLRRNDCVIVPGVGAFVATDRPAVFNVADSCMSPPRRVISFNGALTHDDGLLAASYARRMKISFEQARREVDEEAQLLMRRLKAEGAVDISRIGMLQRASGGRLLFSPQPRAVLELPAVACRTAEAVPVLEVVRPAVPARDKAVAVVRLPLRLKRLRAAAAAAVLLVVSFALSTPIDVEQAQNATLSAPAFTAPEPPMFEVLPAPEGMALYMAPAPSDGMVEASSRPAAAGGDSDPYIVVVASLVSRAQAERFIADSGDSALRVAESGDRYRVYAASGATRDAAQAAMDADSSISSRYPDAWVCRR